MLHICLSVLQTITDGHAFNRTFHAQKRIRYDAQDRVSALHSYFHFSSYNLTIVCALH